MQVTFYENSCKEWTTATLLTQHLWNASLLWCGFTNMVKNIQATGYLIQCFQEFPPRKKSSLLALKTDDRMVAGTPVIYVEILFCRRNSAEIHADGLHRLISTSKHNSCGQVFTTSFRTESCLEVNQRQIAWPLTFLWSELNGFQVSFLWIWDFSFPLAHVLWPKET